MNEPPNQYGLPPIGGAPHDVPPPMGSEGLGVSFTEPMGAATAWTKSMLFAPFQFSRWLVLCVPAFLMQCSNVSPGAGVTNFTSLPGGPGGTGAAGMKDMAVEIETWIAANTTLLGALIGGGIITLILLLLLATFLGARGKFILLDNVLTAREGVTEPWTRLGRLANSLWLWDFLLRCVMLAFGLSLLFVGFRDFLAFLHSEGDMNALFSKGLIGSGCIYVLIAVALAIVKAMVDDFVVPVMYKREALFGAAFGAVFRLAMNNAGTFVLWFLWRLLVWICLLIMIGIATLLVCCTVVGYCLLVIPVLNMLPQLPFHIWWRTYSVLVLEQFGPEWEIFRRDAVVPYDPFPANMGLPPPAL